MKALIERPLNSFVLLVIYGLFLGIVWPQDGPSQANSWSMRGNSLDHDINGWAYHPAVTAGPDGVIYAAWSQHRTPSIDEYVGTYVSCWTNGAWRPLGGRVGHVGKESGAIYPEGYHPSIAVLGNTPYLAWYEGGGYGWSSDVEPSVFVAHWDGSEWRYDPNDNLPNGALNTSASADARNPEIAVIRGALYAAWIEHRRSGNYNVIVVKRLQDGNWIQEGQEFSVNRSAGGRIIDFALVDVAGVPHVAWSEFIQKRTSSPYTNQSSTIQVRKLSGESWIPVGDTLNRSHKNYVGYVAMTARSAVPYVAWQERTSSGNNGLFVKHWDGRTWVPDGDLLNVQPAGGEAGAPALSSDGNDVWLAWYEAKQGQQAQLFARLLSGGNWSAAEGSLNIDPVYGSAGSPVLAMVGEIPHVVWAERDSRTYSKHVYLKGRDSQGNNSKPTFSRFGSPKSAVSLAPKTWTSLLPGGLAEGAGVYDEGFSSLIYSPQIRKAVVFGKYHAVGVAEEQNALLGYDFAQNRWDIIDITEDAGSEYLPGIGHDLGNATIDTVHGLYITHGNLTLNNSLGFQTYIYDLVGGWGKRMLPPNEISIDGPLATAFDPDHDLVLCVGMGLGSDSWTYSHASNVWSVVPNGPSSRRMPGLVYDSRNHIFVLFGGELNDGTRSNETWTFDPAAKVWQRKYTMISPPARRSPSMAFDSDSGLVFMTGGSSSEFWSYDANANTWTRLPDAPPAAAAIGTGAYLTYDTYNKVLLLFSGSSLKSVWAYRHSPLDTRTDSGLPTIPAALQVLASSGTQVSLAWAASSDDVGVVGYRVYRDGVQVGNSSTTDYTDTGLTGGREYTYYITAYDNAGNQSPSSVSVNATTITGDNSPPTAPADLQTALRSGTLVSLSWNASTDNVAVQGYRVFRNETEIATAPTTSYSDSGLSPGVQYSYVVKAYDAAGNQSPPSNTASATTGGSSESSGGIDLTLTVHEPADVARQSVPVRSGVPLPAGNQTASWSLWDGTVEIPLQTTRMLGSTPWLLLDFQTSVGAGKQKTLTLRDATQSKAPAQPVLIDENTEGILVGTGPLRIQIDKGEFNLFDAVWLDQNGDGSFAETERVAVGVPNSIQAMDAISGTAYSGSGRPKRLIWEYRGPIRSVLRVDGAFRNGTKELLDYTIRISFFSGRTDLLIEYILRNSCQTNQRNLKIKSSTLKIGAGSTQVRASRSGSMSWANHSAAGERFEIIPRIYGKIDWDLNGGMILPDLSHHGASITVDFAEGLTAEEQSKRTTSARSPLLALAPSKWYSLYGNLTGGNFGTLDDEKRAYKSWGWSWRSSQEPIDAHKPDYDAGWNAIDVHNDSEADDVWQNLIMYLRTAQRGYFDRARGWARYYKWDYTFRTDGFNYASDSSWEGPAHSFLRPPLAIQLTTTDSTHLTRNVKPGKIDVRDWGADHLYGWGLIDYYYLTGDLDAIDAAEDIGEISRRVFQWRTAGQYGMAAYGGRQGARHLLFLTRLYEVTQDPEWEADMHHLAQLWLRSPDWDPRGFYYTSAFATDAVITSGSYAAGARLNSILSMGIISVAIDRYYAITGNSIARDRLISQAQWAQQYALDATYQYSSSSIALDYRSPGTVWQGYFSKASVTFFDPQPTTWFIDSLVRGFRLTGNRSFLERAKLHWERASKARHGVPITVIATDTQVGHFMNDRFNTGGHTYVANGDLPYAHLLFFEYARTGTTPLEAPKTLRFGEHAH